MKVLSIIGSIFLVVLALVYFIDSHDRYGQAINIQQDNTTQAIDKAIKKYHFENDGQWPNILEDLVPNYLPAIPEGYCLDTANPDLKVTDC
ncbi:hypothetical protein CL634_04320 [bacterium]|nr:hypothetical protein [bacterium]|tara:strand:+ start:2130 stop:2402 length:273 start_codon:yes stop_codon:yes gene_type:complete